MNLEKLDDLYSSKGYLCANSTGPTTAKESIFNITPSGR